MAAILKGPYWVADQLEAPARTILGLNPAAVLSPQFKNSIRTIFGLNCQGCFLLQIGHAGQEPETAKFEDLFDHADRPVYSVVGSDPLALVPNPWSNVDIVVKFANLEFSWPAPPSDHYYNGQDLIQGTQGYKDFRAKVLEIKGF